MTNIVFLLIGIVLGVCISLRGDAGKRSENTKQPENAKPSENSDTPNASSEAARPPEDLGE
ncbi:MAG: hypothetical protein LBK23_09285 [Oscillospiraceae bacterium]|jgi:F0F1-type ATP synthase assembly protein I|nr:hypothetical protein [Oscillospiraceae bacterium]